MDAKGEKKPAGVGGPDGVVRVPLEVLVAMATPLALARSVGPQPRCFIAASMRSPNFMTPA